MSLHRSKARTLTHVAQIVGLLALAILIIVIIAPRMEVAPPVVEGPTTSVPTTVTEQNGAAPAIPQNDWTMLTASLNQIREPMANVASAATDNEATEAPETASTDEPRPNPAPPGWQYVGYAQTPEGAISALVMVNSKQRFVREGRQIEGFSIVDITTSHLLIERDGRRFEVKRSEPAPFDARMATADARARAAGEAERGRTARMEQLQMQQLEEARRRRAAETGELVLDEPFPERPQQR